VEGSGSQVQAEAAERLRAALEQRAFTFHYQPIVDLEQARDARRAGETGLRTHMSEVEALLRWEDESGVIPPSEFIALAENTGMIELIGDWALDEACRQSRTWADHGLELGVAVNLSLRQLWQSELVEKMTRAVESAGIAPERLTAEITESAALADLPRTKRILSELRNRGFQLTIDDFGTFNVSLASISEMPIHTLKIDRSVVARVPDDTIASIMVTAVVEAAHNREVLTLAVGIETEEQLDFLVDRGCTRGQGYLFSRPVPADEIEAL
jgi:EAL domain-containing protein (putative c-di-GMP-specific phosphodiesterase class I)